MIILTIIVFILIFGALVFSHELGHFIAAKKSGIKVEEFGFGFPPRIFGVKKGETTYSINAIPLGGFVKIYGEERGEKDTRSKFAFYNRPAWNRAIILAAGVFMNLLLAAVLLSVVYAIGIPTIVENGQSGNFRNIQVQIVEVAAGSPAQNAGIQIGDAIQSVAFNGQTQQINQADEVQGFIAMHIGEQITFTIRRGNETLVKDLTPRPNPPQGEGAVGIAMTKTGLVSYPWYSAIVKGFATTGSLIVTFIGAFWALIHTLILKGTVTTDVTGPVGIAVLTSQVVKLGVSYVLQFAAIISINLAIINVLPFPALDGGRLLFLLIEKVKGKPINFKTERAANAIGFALLIVLMIVVTFRDVIKLF